MTTGAGIRRRSLGLTLLAGVALAIPAEGAGQHIRGTTTWNGMFRVRPEIREVSGGESRAFTGMRVRAGLSHALSPDILIYAEAQDVRLWGEETSTLDGSAEALDMHQGYMQFGHRGESLLWARVGRQEMEFSDGRLVAFTPFSNFGRSFDGVRLALRAGDNTMVDGFGMQIRESAAEPTASDAAFFGLWSRTRLPGGHDLQLFGLHDVEEGAGRTGRTTLGSEYRGGAGALSWRALAAYQTGELAGLDLSAWMAAATTRLALGDRRGGIALWYDHYSGDATPDAGSIHNFEDLFNRNHRFLGRADVFRGERQDNQGRGIRDLAVKFQWGFSPRFNLNVDAHRFLVADDDGLDSPVVLDELDVFVRTRIIEGFSVLSLVAWASPTETGRLIGTAPGNLVSGYLWFEATF
jgi:hypothetical protein